MNQIPLYETRIYDGCEKTLLECYVKTPSPDLTKEKRPVVVIFPGGGYEFTSDREAEPIANLFQSAGYSAFVVRYTLAPDCHEIYPLIDAAQAIVHVRKNADKYNIDPTKIAVCGFSAGGHLAAYISTCWNDSRVLEALGISGEEARPDATILAYPVISGFHNPNEQSVRALLSTSEPTDEERRRISCELRVDDRTPPAFIWSTSNDDCVPVTNSLDYSAALYSHHIPYELHVFPLGWHGLSLANKETSPDWDRKGFDLPYVARWTRWATEWLDSTFYAPDYSQLI